MPIMVTIMNRITDRMEYPTVIQTDLGHHNKVRMAANMTVMHK